MTAAGARDAGSARARAPSHLRNHHPAPVATPNFQRPASAAAGGQHDSRAQARTRVPASERVRPRESACHSHTPAVSVFRLLQRVQVAAPARTVAAPCGLACCCFVAALAPRVGAGAAPVAPALAAGMASAAAAAAPISYLSAAAAAEIDDKLMGNMGYSLDQLMVSAGVHVSGGRRRAGARVLNVCVPLCLASQIRSWPG